MKRSRYRTAYIMIGMLLVTGAFLLSSCIKKESYPLIPEIGFSQFITEFDTTSAFAKRGILVFSFTDGDGDLGLKSSDTLPPYQKNGNYYYNLVIDYYEKQAGQFVKVSLDPPFSARIPYLSNYPDKPIKGIITDTLTLNPAPLYDTIKLVFFLYDRALNKSNVDSTPPIVLRRHR